VKTIDDEPRPAEPPVDAPRLPRHDSLPNSVESSPTHKKLVASQPTSPALSSVSSTSSNKRSSFDTRLMRGFYEACVSKFVEQEKTWNENWQSDEYPLELSKKNKIYELFRTYIKTNNEQCVMIQNFDYSDLQAFESFLQSLKYDGLNSINKYKHYLESRDLNRINLDLVILHEKYGLIVVDTKESDYLDNKRRMKIKSHLTQVRYCFENLNKLVNDAKGLHGSETVKLPVIEVLALPNIHERPRPSPTPMDKAGKQPTDKYHSKHREMTYLVKSDLDDFGKWWSDNIADKHVEQATVDKKTRLSSYTNMLSLINCVRNNLVIPVVSEEIDEKHDDKRKEHHDKERKEQHDDKTKEQDRERKEHDDKPKSSEEPKSTKPDGSEYRYNVCAEFFHEKHERLRTLSKVCLSSNDKDKIRRCVSLQILWVLLNDAQKKLSVVTADKAYYEEYFQKQRRLYNTTLNNVRFYSDMQSCPDTTEAHTLRKDNEMWLFVSEASMLNDVFERTKDLPSYWIFAHEAKKEQLSEKLQKYSDIKSADLDELSEMDRALVDTKPWVNDLKLKFPLRLTCDLLVIGDIVAQNQVKMLNEYLKDSVQSKYYQPISKKLRSVKYLRGGSIENIRQVLKMHDQIQSKIVLLHVGDEEIFKTRNAQATVDHIKELTSLIKEYCPKSFVVLSTLMRRMSKSENLLSQEVNKGVISFCKQSKDTSNLHYMLNNHFNPDYHTYEGKVLSNKGLRLYVDNILFVVDYFYVKKNKQT
jgi:hypothetical protein